jgi:acetyl esterase/lipase
MRTALIAATLAVAVTVSTAIGPSPSTAAPRIATTRFVYGWSDHHRLVVYEFVSTRRSRPRAAVLLVHGGGWAHGSAAGFSGVARELADAGFAAFDVDYSLARIGEPGLLEEPREVAAAANWIMHRAARLDIRPGELGALGSSAGGNLIARVALGHAVPDLRAVVTWSGPMDLANFAPMVERSCRGTHCGPHWLASDLLAYVGCLPQHCASAWSRASPVSAVRPGAPAMLVVSSGEELVPISGTRLFVARLRHARDAVQLIVFRGHRHAGQYGGSAIGATVRFLRSHLVSRQARAPDGAAAPPLLVRSAAPAPGPSA